jgi:hypothetical protein
MSQAVELNKEYISFEKQHGDQKGAWPRFWARWANLPHPRMIVPRANCHGVLWREFCLCACFARY